VNKQGNRPLDADQQYAGHAEAAGRSLQNKAIVVSHGTWKFTGDDTAVLDYTLDIYLPSADADGDGFPDAGAQPVLAVPTVDNAKRVPIL